MKKLSELSLADLFALHKYFYDKYPQTMEEEDIKFVSVIAEMKRRIEQIDFTYIKQ